MKIILAALNAKYIHSNLAVYDLAAYTMKKRQEHLDSVKNLQLLIKEYTINNNLDLILQSLYSEKAEVYAFSCYIWNIREILALSKELKKLLPDSHIWYGGPEVSYDSMLLLQNHPYIEGIMLGEGEITFYELATAWSQSVFSFSTYSKIAGILFRDSEGLLHQTEPRPFMDLDELPFIYAGTSDPSSDCAGFQDLAHFQNKILYYETSRGCPFSCSYCLSSIDKRVRFRSFDLVKSELDFFLRHRVPQVKFIDRTFNCKKSHSLPIWRYLLEHDNGFTNFHFEVSADLIGEEELEILRQMRPGLIQLEIGLQSTNPDTIREIRRTMDLYRIKQVLHRIHTFGNIHQHLDLIAGLPYEDFSSFQKSFNDAYAMEPDQLQLGFLKVLKGSYMEEQTSAYGLTYKDLPPYEILSTKWMTYDEILKLKRVEEVVEAYYNSAQFRHVLSYVVSLSPDPFQFYEAFGIYYQDNGLSGIGFKREARYQALRDFCSTYFQDSRFDLSLFEQLLTFDYYLRENVKNRPSWSTELPIPHTDYSRFFQNGGNTEISLKREGYDSKSAARMMHIEPISVKALPYMEDISGAQDFAAPQESIMFCLFDYENRNALTKDADVVLFHSL